MKIDTIQTIVLVTCEPGELGTFQAYVGNDRRYFVERLTVTYMWDSQRWGAKTLVAAGSMVKKDGKPGAVFAENLWVLPSWQDLPGCAPRMLEELRPLLVPSLTGGPDEAQESRAAAGLDNGEPF